MDAGHGVLMDRIYRHQRYFYDATRKYYLLGRDQLIEALAPPRNGTVLEIGCGTGRNLLSVRRCYPQARLFGLDISEVMLATARSQSQGRNILFARADAGAFDPQQLFGVGHFDRIFISYALSMIPPWQAVLRHAGPMLAPGGELHIVDFGQQERLPKLFRSVLRTWLAWFHVIPRAEMRERLEELARAEGASVEFKQVKGGYAWLFAMKKPAATSSPGLSEGSNSSLF